MRFLAGIAGAILIALMLTEFFVTFLLPRRVKRDPRIARGLIRVFWLPWRALASRLHPAPADTLLGIFGPLALISELITWTVGLMLGFAFLEWAIVGGAFSDRLLLSSGLFLSAASAGGSYGARVLGLFEAATGVGVLFTVIGYMPSVYGAFSRRETAVSQLATLAGSPPAAGGILRNAADRARWRELEEDFKAWEAWTAELMETHLSYPILGFYRSQHVNQNWLAALTAMVDVGAFVSAVEGDPIEAAELTFAIGRHALSDLALQYAVRPADADRLNDEQFDLLYDEIESAASEPVPKDEARRRLSKLRAQYEPNAQGLSRALMLDLPPWLPADEESSARIRRLHAGDRRDLVG